MNVQFYATVPREWLRDSVLTRAIPEIVDRAWRAAPSRMLTRILRIFEENEELHGAFGCPEVVDMFLGIARLIESYPPEHVSLEVEHTTDFREMSTVICVSVAITTSWFRLDEQTRKAERIGTRIEKESNESPRRSAIARRIALRGGT